MGKLSGVTDLRSPGSEDVKLYRMIEMSRDPFLRHVLSVKK
jgi:hypothetical protein